MQSGKAYRNTYRRGRRYYPPRRPYTHYRSRRSGRSYSENSDAVSYNSGSGYSSSRSRTPRGLRCEPVRRRRRKQSGRPRGRLSSFHSSSLSRSESSDDAHGHSNSSSRHIGGRRYCLRSQSASYSTTSSVSSSSLWSPETRATRSRQRRISQHQCTRLDKNSDSMRCLENKNSDPREKAPKVQPTAVAEPATGRQMQVMLQKTPDPFAPSASTAAAPSSMAPQTGIPSSAAQRGHLSSPLPVYALDSNLKEPMPARVGTTALGEAANIHRSTLEDEETYEQWLHGGRAVTPSWSTGINTLSRFYTAIAPVTESQKSNGSTPSTPDGTSAIFTDWRRVRFESHFFVATDLNALQKAPALISTPNGGGVVAAIAKTACAQGASGIENAPHICNSGPEKDSKLVDFDEFDNAFKQSFMTGKVHPKPPWYLCALYEDCREHPYYVQWLDTLKLLPSLEDQLTRSRERVKRIAVQGSKSSLNT